MEHATALWKFVRLSIHIGPRLTKLAMTPEEIPLGYYTHINFAFALINPTTFRMDHMDAQTATMYSRVTKLKQRQPSLEVWIGERANLFVFSISNEFQQSEDGR